MNQLSLFTPNTPALIPGALRSRPASSAAPLVTKLPLGNAPAVEAPASSPDAGSSSAVPPCPPCLRGESPSSPGPGRADCHTILNLMRDATWRTPYEIADLTNIGILSIPPRLRDLRKPRYGANQVNTRQRTGAPKGTFEYQVITPFGT